MTNDIWTKQDEISHKAISLFKIMYGGKKEYTLTKLRYNKYMDMACKGVLEPQKTLPTESAVYFHGFRAHLQITTWKLLDNEFQLKPEDWGCQFKNDTLVTIETDNKVAPERFLKVDRCKCNTSSKNGGSNLCSCRKYGLNCVVTCGGCRGEECNNLFQYRKMEHAESSDNEWDGRNVFKLFEYEENI